jgi:hypothetical protein
MRRLTLLVAASCAAVVASACHRSHQVLLAGDDGGDDAGDDAGLGGDSLPPPLMDGADDAESGPADCPDETKFVYVVSEERTLYKFDPQAVAFTAVGDVDCAGGSFANSMAVDRQGNAWINYGDGSLWRSSAKSGGCFSTGFKTNQEGVGLFGMGFTAKSSGSSQETLFICDLMGGGLGIIDLPTMTLARLGPFTGSLAGRDAELTGTADGNLYGFFVGSPLGDAGSASVVDIDLASEGEKMTWTLPTVDTGSDWAFSFWGGDFYLYTADKYSMSDPFSTVTRFRPSDGSVTVLAQNIGFRIVGAGVSTCAPTTPPK